MKANQSNIHILNANLGRWLGSPLPAPVVDAAYDSLRQNPSARKLRGFWIRAFGDDLHLHLTTFNGDFAPDEDSNAFAAHLAREAVLAALAKGFEMGLGEVQNGTNPLHLSGPAQDAALDLRRLDYPFTERPSEPIFVAKALNASWGFFNRALFNLYFNPDKGSGHRTVSRVTTSPPWSRASLT